MPASSGSSSRRRPPGRRWRASPIATPCCSSVRPSAWLTAAWGFSGDPIRAVAVLVVATPCPLILAVPVALVAGLSRAARAGHPDQGRQGPGDDGPRRGARARQDRHADRRAAAAGRDHRNRRPRRRRGSAPRRVARPGVQAYDRPHHRRRSAGAWAWLSLSRPRWPKSPGEGVVGQVEGHRVVVGGSKFVAARLGLDASALPRDCRRTDGRASAVDGELAGVLILADALRAGTKRASRRPARGSASSASCWPPATAMRSPHAIDQRTCRFNAVRADLTPDEKVLRGALRAQERPGDDGWRRRQRRPGACRRGHRRRHGCAGAAASAEAADVVLLVDQLDRILPGAAHCAPRAGHRAAERCRRGSVFPSRDDRCRSRLSHARSRERCCRRPSTWR